MQDERFLTSEEIIKIVDHSSFQSIYEFVVKTLKETRKPKITPLQLLKVQANIVKKIIPLEQDIELLKDKADRESQNIEWLSREIYKAQRRVLMQVMDGVAWRLLKTNRPLLRALAGHPQTGHLNLKGFFEEARYAELVVRNLKSIVILNDLTNFLRYGDITGFYKDKLIIKEIKLKGKAKGNQKKKLSVLIEELNSKTIRIADMNAQYVEIDGYPKNFLPQVEKLLIKAKQSENGIRSMRVAPYLWVICMYFDNVNSYFKKTDEMSIFPSNPFKPSDAFSAAIDNFMLFDSFSPNAAPYSIFPFEESLVADIMMGKVRLVSFISKSNLVKSLEGKGWHLQYSNEILELMWNAKTIAERKSLVKDSKHFPVLSKGSFVYKIPREVLLRIGSEFLSAKVVVDMAEHAMATSKPGSNEYLAQQFKEEWKIWK